MESNFIQLLTIIISVVSIFVSFALGQWSKSVSYKREQLEKRYLQLYIPFFKRLAEYNYPVNDYYKIMMINDPSFIKVEVLKNIEYLDKDSVEYLKLLLRLDRFIHEYSLGKIEYEGQVITANETFSELVFSMKKESIKISKKLKLESVTEDIL